jgi:transposase
MNATTVAVDLAKDVIELAVADGAGRVVERRRVGRKAFSVFLATHLKRRIVMEACGGAHHWARVARAAGHDVRLLPAQYVRPYRRRNKTDRADCAALLEAVRNPDIVPVPVKHVQAQAIQGLHRIRSQWIATRTARINVLRGLLREFGLVLPVGSVRALKLLPEAIDDAAVPAALQASLHNLLGEIRVLEARIIAVERQLGALTREVPSIERLRQISGIGLLTATALYASAGDAKHFKSGRHLAAWIGLTPKEYSSGHTRRLGRISKRGDVYVRTLLTHGARAVLARAKQMHEAGQTLNRLQAWALALQSRAGHNKATCALANKLARIAWATWRYERDFEPNHAKPVAA